MSEFKEPAPTYPKSGYAGGYPQPEPYRLLRPISGLGLALQILLGVHFLASAGTFAAALNERSLIHRIVDDPDSVTLDEANSADSLINGLGVVSLLLYIATGVVWIVWLYRARLNVSAWNSYAALSRPGWTIGMWFIPFANLVGPAIITKGIAEETDRTGQEYGAKRPQPAVIVWGISFAIMAIAGLVARAESTGIDEDGATIDDVVSYADVLPVTTAITMLAAIPAVVLVRSLTRRQTARIEQSGAVG